MESLLEILISCGDHFDESFAVADMANPDHPLVYVNDAFCKLTGYKFDEIKGRNCRFLQGEETNKATVERLKNAIEEEKSCFFDLLNYKKNNLPFWNRLVLFPIGMEEGECSYFVGVQINVFESENAIQELNKHQEQVDNQVKNPFQKIIKASRALKYADLGDGQGLPSTEELATEIRNEVKSISEFLKSV